MQKEKVGILGTGEVGRSLARGFISRGYSVMLGSRDADSDKVRDLACDTGARTGTFEDAAIFGDIVVLSTLWSGTENALRLAGTKNLAGKIVIDTTNPLVFAPNAPPALTLGHTDSGGEQVQRWLPDARVVKCFNTVGHAHMVDPQFPGGPPDMFLCGNDAGAKTIVSEICRELGWPTVDIGGIEGSRLLEPLCILWVSYGIRNNSWNHAFKMLRK